MVKIFEMLEAAGFASMDRSHEKQQMAAAFVLCDRDGEPAVAAAK